MEQRTQARPHSAGFWVLYATILGSSLVFIDGAVVSIALPIVQTELHASASDAQWVVEGYTLVLGALMLLCGALADRYGRKRIFISGVSLFAAGSLACALAPTMATLLIARVLQGAGGTLLAPASLAILGEHFRGTARGKAVGTWSALTALAATIGPIAGGIIVDHFSWRWVFGINLPLCAIITFVAWRYLKESRDDEAAAHLDIAGSAAITLALGAIVYTFIEAGNSGWHEPRVIAAGVGGMLSLATFAWLERRLRHPLVPLDLFAQPTFAGVNALTFLLYGALSGVLYFLPFVFIRVEHYRAAAAGAATLPFIAFLVLLSRASGALTYRLGARTLLSAGPAIVALGFAAFGLLPGDAYLTRFFPAISLVGLGMGITVAPLTATLMESVAEHRIGLASGINNALSRVAGLLAIATLGLLLAGIFNARLDRRLAAARVTAPGRAAVNAQRIKLAGASLQDRRLEAIVLRAYDDGFRSVAMAGALLCACGGICALLLVTGRKGASRS